MENALAELKARYALLSDNAVREAFSLGSASYSATAWAVIGDEMQSRGLESDVALEPQAQETEQEDTDQAQPESSPFFLYSRFFQGRSWKRSRPLPDLGLQVLGYFCLVGGAIRLWWGVSVLRDAWLGIVDFEWVANLALVLMKTGVFVVASFVAIQFRRPWGWYYLVVISIGLPLSHFVQSEPAKPWLILILFPVYLGTWLLYLARRREAFGLQPYRWAL